MTDPHLKHKHDCKHELAVCSHCDVAFCKLCEREWLVPCAQNHYPWAPLYGDQPIYYGSQAVNQWPTEGLPVGDVMARIAAVTPATSTPHTHVGATG